MEIRILGAHNAESESTRLSALLIDDVLAIDAGGLTASLSLPTQERIKRILLSHYHYDHIKDIATLGLNTYASGTIEISCTQEVIEALFSHILNGRIWPKLWERPAPEAPSLRFQALEPEVPVTLDGYGVLCLPVNHTVPTVGIQVTSPEGKSFFYTGDTGPGLSHCWERISPELLIAEVTLPDRFQELAQEVKHLTPLLLRQELLDFQRIRGYLPRVVTIHMSPYLEQEIREGLGALSRELGASITPGYEGMKLRL